jgi:hypothetical protein
MNLYIINNVLFDYTDGMAVIAAESMEQCREIFVKRFVGDYHAEEFDQYATFKVIEGVDHAAGLVSHVFGGG